MALKVFPFPMQLTSLQYFISMLAVVVLVNLSMLSAEALQWTKIKQ